jgi:hypothetical protein
LRIFFDAKKTKELQDALVDKWFEISQYGGDLIHGMEEHESIPHGEEYHVYSVIYCPMKYICKQLGYKRKFTRTSIGVMFIGIVAQKLIQWLYPPKEREYESVLPNAVVGHLDVYEKLRNPIEIKASRKRVFRPEHLPDKWVDQETIYIAMENARIGWIVVVNVVSCHITAFCVDMTYEDVKYAKNEIYHRIDHLDELRRTKDYKKANINPDEYLYCDFKTTCPEKSRCKYLNAQLKKDGRQQKLV